MRKFIVFSPLAAFLAWAVHHLASAGPRPFLLRWIDVSMAFMLALVATLVLKQALLGKDEGSDDDRGHP